MGFFSQEKFYAHWGHLQDTHVRALAWLLTSPHLLKQDTQVWDGAIVTPSLSSESALHDFLTLLDQNPVMLHAELQEHPTRRLGLYAETLLAFFLTHFYQLYAHGLQIHDAHARTIGEFDFLVQHPQGLVHWELATKFYLLFDDANIAGTKKSDLFDYLGPNLADTLGAKMHKIVHQQLRLSEHIEASSLLPAPLVGAQALIKGWLFYRDPVSISASNLVDGVALDHCRGYIWRLSDLQLMADFSGVILDRLLWLAPVQMPPQEIMCKQSLIEKVTISFLQVKTPIMLAITSEQNGYAREICRGMIVPDDWWDQACEARDRLKPGMLKPNTQSD